MIPLLNVHPTACEPNIKRPAPKRIARDLASRNTLTADEMQLDEVSIFKLITWFFVLLILPA